MVTSIFLAKAIGLYLLIIGIAMLANIKLFKNLVNEFVNNAALLFLSGVIALILGILLIVIHNSWQMNWTVVITLIAWLAFIKGIVRTVLPNVPLLLMRKNFMQEKMTYYVSGIICILLGIFLCYHGFFGSMS